MPSRVCVLLVAVLLAGISGCQKLRFEKTYDLSAGVPHSLEFDPPAYQQRVTVTITPTAAGVSAYLCKESDAREVTKVLEAVKGEPRASALLGSRVSKGEAETYTFEATVPAKTAYTLLLKSLRATQVRVEVIGR